MPLRALFFFLLYFFHLFLWLNISVISFWLGAGYGYVMVLGDLQVIMGVMMFLYWEAGIYELGSE